MRHSNDRHFQRLLRSLFLFLVFLLFSRYRLSKSTKAKSTVRASSYRRWPRFVNPLDKSQVGTRSVGAYARLVSRRLSRKGDNFHYIVINAFATY